MADKQRPTRKPAADRRLADLLDQPRGDLEWHYALGQALAENLEAGPYRGESARGLARRLGIGRTVVERHLAFAREFTAADLANLPRTWSAVIALLSVRDPDVRTRLLRSAVTWKWPIVRLREEVRAAQSAGPDRNPPIRQPRVAPDLGELFHLAELAGVWVTRWRRWGELLPAREREGRLREYAHRSGDDEPSGRSGRERLAEASALLHELAEAAGTLLRDLDRVVRPTQQPGDPDGDV